MGYGFLVAGLMAAGLAWLCNTLFRSWGWYAIVFIAPAVEEGWKTGLAFIGNVSIPATHMIFGLVEGFWEGLVEGKVRAGIIGIVLHSFIGLLTYGIVCWTGSILGAFFVAYGIHMAWNHLVRIVCQKRQAK